MITNFEVITGRLSRKEKEAIPPLVERLRGHGKNNPIKAKQLCSGLPSMTGARLRKITNFIRANSLLPVIATARGYYVSYDERDISGQMRSLYERADAIIHSADGLATFLGDAQ